MLAYHRIRPPAAELRDTEQQGDDKAEYGIQLLEHLSEDLKHKLGSGFSIRNLRNMRRFYLNHRILQTSAELKWSQHVALLPVKNSTVRRRLERQIVNEKLPTHIFLPPPRSYVLCLSSRRTRYAIRLKNLRYSAKDAFPACQF